MTPELWQKVGRTIHDLRKLEPSQREEIWKLLQSEELQQIVETQQRLKTNWFGAFVTGIGSVLEMFPSPARFDRWRMKEGVAQTEWSLLFRELWESTHAEDSQNRIAP